MKTILFLHGFFASGSCIPAKALKDAFSNIESEDRVQVLTPDISIHPDEAMMQIRTICENEHVDLLVGNSCGSFYAQMIAQELKIPALLGNPYLRMTEFLKTRLGEHEYKSPRADGNQLFTITDSLVQEFAELEDKQFNHYDPKFANKIWAIFGKQDTLAHFEPLYLQYYSDTHYFPGGHTPTSEEVRLYYVPLIEQMLKLFTDNDKLSDYEIYCQKMAEDQEDDIYDASFLDDM